MRTVRHRKPENFLGAVGRNGHGISEEELLGATEAADEALVMGLRLREGIDVGLIASRFGLDSVVDWAKVERLVRSGHLTSNGQRIATTARGRLLLDAILAEIALPKPKASAVPVAMPESPAPLAQPLVRA